MKQAVILATGKEVSLLQWQEMNGLAAGQLSKNFSVTEFRCKSGTEYFRISEVLIRFLQAFRDRIGKPVRINAGYRTEEYQEELRKRGLKAAKFSPHCKGMAADVDTLTWEQTLEYVKIMQALAEEQGIKIRLGYITYHDSGSTFIHIDVCPEYYLPGKPFRSLYYPWQWIKVFSW